MPKLNAKREAVLADARTGRYTCRELAEKHGLAYSSVYAMCYAAGVKLPKHKAVQARAQQNVKRCKGERVKESVALASMASGRAAVRRLPERSNEGEEIVVPLTARTSALLWSGVASLPLAEQAELLRKLAME